MSGVTNSAVAGEIASLLYPSGSALFIMSTQIGRARVEPYPPFKMGAGVSNPTQTAQLREEVYPAYQASL